MSKKIKSKPARPTLNLPVAVEFKRTLTDFGYREPQLSMLMAQAAYETTGFNFKKALDNHNYGGIKFQRTFKNLATPSGNFSAPPKEDIKIATYASFKDTDDFVKKWARIAHLNESLKDNDIGAPLKARTLPDYAHRLKLNHYYQDAETVYSGGMVAWNDVIQKELSGHNPSVQSLPENDNSRSESNLRASEFAGYGFRDITNYMRRAVFADQVRVPKPFTGYNRTTQRLKDDNKLTAVYGNLIQINSMMDFSKSIMKFTNSNTLGPKQRLNNRYSGDVELTSNIVQAYNGNTAIRANRKIKGFQNRNDSLNMPSIARDEIMRNIFMDHAGIKNKWSTPESYEPIPAKYSIPFKDSRLTERDNGKIPFDTDKTAKSVEHANRNEPDHHLYNINTRDDSMGGKVNINLNAPLIGCFTVRSEDTGIGRNNLNRQVEEALLEILNSANEIH